MQVILLERIAKLGQMGDTVNVRPGFARNFLLPQGKALRATKQNMERFEQERVQLEARNLERRQEAEGVGEKLAGLSFVCIRQAGETGQLYGSVSTRDIAETLDADGFTIARNQVELKTPIKTIGLHEVTIALHPEVDVAVNINVARSADEAERQARGEDLTQRDEGFILEVEDEDEDEEGLEDDASEDDAPVEAAEADDKDNG